MGYSYFESMTTSISSAQREELKRLVFVRVKMHRAPYISIVNGMEIVVHPDVFSPQYFTDSAWFAEIVPELVGTNRLLDLGTGTGIIAVAAALGGATVAASDINPSAVINARENFLRYKIEAPLWCSDMFEKIPREEKFDVIFWNHPFDNSNNPHEEMLLRGGFDYHYQSLLRYCREAFTFLSTSGIVLLGTSNFGDLDAVKALVKKCGCTLTLIRHKRTPHAVTSFVENEYFVYEVTRSFA